MIRETLRVSWKIIRRAGQGRNINTYCSYVAENENKQHKLKTVEGTKLFDLLSNYPVSKNENQYSERIFLDGIYYKDKLLFVTNFRIM